MAIDLSRIDNIIFDLGVVLLNIDVDAPFRELKKLGIEDFDARYTTLIDSGLMIDLEVGIVTPQAFRDGIRKVMNLNISDRELDRIWNTVLLDFPDENIRLLENLKRSYDTYILSNTNTIHCEEYTRKLKDEFGYQDLGELVKYAYYSHDMQLRKPGQKIYQKVLDEQKLVPEETLFIDDLWENVESAKQLGIQAYHLTPVELVVDLFK